MKPNADMITKILHNFRVNGKFDQDRLIIGRGIDEVLTIKVGEDQPGIKTATFNDVTYYRRPDLDQFAYNPSIIKNVYGNVQEGTPSRIIYYDTNPNKWYGNNYSEGSSIGSSTPIYAADGGTEDSLEGTVWHYLTGGVDTWTCSVGEIGDTYAPSIRYTPGQAGGKQYTLVGVAGDPVLGNQVTLTERPVPTTASATTYVHPNQTTVWTSSLNDNDPQWIAFVGTDASPAAGSWTIMYLGEGGWNIDFGTLSWMFIGNEYVTWDGNTPSCYIEDNSDWSVTGYYGANPSQLTMSYGESIPAKLEYTTDGSTWHSLAGTSGGGTVEYEPIVFTHTDLQPDGTLKIQHDFNDQFPMCLGYTPEPRNLTLLQHQIILDYSDQNSSNLSGAVWFVGSKQSMLLVGGGGDWNDPSVDGPPDQIYVNTAGNPYGSEYNEANGWYVLDSAINDNVTVDPDDLSDYRNRTWRRTTDTGYEFVVQATDNDWYIICVKHPYVMYEYDLYWGRGSETTTVPWLITDWEDRNMGGQWTNIVTLEEPESV